MNDPFRTGIYGDFNPEADADLLRRSGQPINRVAGYFPDKTAEGATVNPDAESVTPGPAVDQRDGVSWRDKFAGYKPPPRTHGLPPVGPPREPVALPVPSPEPSGTPSGTSTPTDRPPVGVAPDDPAWLAAGFLTRYAHPDGRTLARWGADYFTWNGRHYRRPDQEQVRAELAKHIDAVFARLYDLARLARDHGDGKKPPKKLKTTPPVVAGADQFVRAETLVPGDTPPCWITARPGDPSPTDLLACQNGLLDVAAAATGRPTPLRPHTPRLFHTSSVEYPYDPLAVNPPPVLAAFLRSVWPDDPDAVRHLQEWFGYLLTADMSQEKMLLMIGPPRCGKGTIARHLIRLLGSDAVASPTLASLAGEFGLHPLVGKTLAIIPDARVSGRTDVAVSVERLLSITGRDALDINRKHRDMLPAVQLFCRIILMSNEVPRLPDASGALATRYSPLRFTRSFKGQEDRTLDDRLAQPAELAGTLLWAIDGLKRLKTRGWFDPPASAAELLDMARELGQPVETFVSECCEVGTGGFVTTSELYDAWCRWSASRGHKLPTTVEVFTRDLMALSLDINPSRPRVDGSRQQGYRNIRLLLDREMNPHGGIPD